MIGYCYWKFWLIVLSEAQYIFHRQLYLDMKILGLIVPSITIPRSSIKKHSAQSLLYFDQISIAVLNISEL